MTHKSKPFYTEINGQISLHPAVSKLIVKPEAKKAMERKSFLQ